MSRRNAIDADDIARICYRSWDELFGIPRAEVEALQLKAARQRFEALLPTVAALRDQAERHGVTRLRDLDDLVPLLFNHTVHKSYPLSLIESNRFDLLTNWLGRLTAIDVSQVDVRSCQGIDEWMTAIEEQTALQVYHTSGTSGKISFYPRSTLERDLWNHCFLAAFDGFGSEPGVKLGGPGGPRMPVVYPSARYGRYMSMRLVDFLSQSVAPTPDQVYTLNNGTLSADLVSLAGRVRVAQAKGEVANLRFTEGQRAALRRYIAAQEHRGEETARFFERIATELRGQRVFLFSQTSYLVQAAQDGKVRGLAEVFAPDSVALTGGGGKEVVLPPDWYEQICAFTGITHWTLYYAMTELNGVMPACPQGYYHIPPYIVPFLLDPETGDVLPREGCRTGRFAGFDLLAQTYWAGVVSGDMVTIEWDRKCPCGRQGAHLHKGIDRYSAQVTGDDKVTCASTVDNTDVVLQKLLAD